MVLNIGKYITPMVSNKRRRVLLVVVVLLVVFRLITGGSESTESTDVLAAVSLVSIEELKSAGSEIEATGLVTAVSSADVRAEAAGQVTGVYVDIGQEVFAGQLLATLSNADAKAAVAQAQASLAAQEAQLASLNTGARDEERAIQDAQLLSATRARDEAARSLVRSIYDSRITAEDAVYSKLDVLFEQTNTQRPQLLSSIIGSPQLEIDVEAGRGGMPATLNQWLGLVDETDVDSDLDGAVSEVRSYIDDLIVVLDGAALLVAQLESNNNLTQTQIDTYATTIAAARSAVSGSNAALGLSLDKYAAARASLVAAQKQAQIIETGVTVEVRNTQEALVAQARASVAAAQAQLAKTIITAPVAGEVVAFSVEVGDYTSPGQFVAHVASVGNVEITTQLSARDARAIVVGDDVRIDGEYSGSVLRVARGINPQAGKVEAIVVPEAQHAGMLTAGEYVDLTIITGGEVDSSGSFVLPFRSIKVGSTGSAVFRLSGENMIEEVRIETGETMPGGIEVLSDLADVTHIIDNVRGIDVGDRVRVDS